MTYSTSLGRPAVGRQQDLRQVASKTYGRSYRCLTFALGKDIALVHPKEEYHQMQLTVQEIISALEERIPLALQESYDNSGLQIGEPTTLTESALLCVDLTEAVVQEAIALGSKLIITHHPPLFKPLRQLVGRTYIERALLLAIRSGIAIYSAHTNADNAPEGINYLLANDFGLKDCQPLSPLTSAQAGALLGTPLEADKAGSGIVGDLEEPIPLERMLERIKTYFGTDKLSYTPTNQSTVQRIAICGGAGSFLFSQARRLGADLLITGEAKYNDYFDSEACPILVTVGHYESEVIATRLFRGVISDKFPTFALYISKLNSNPIVSI